MTLLLALPAAAALLALWLAARFPWLLAPTIRAALLTFGLSLVLVWALARATAPLIVSASVLGPPAAVVLVLSALVCAWISVVSLLRLVHEDTPGP
jgi:hypothetical protein